MAFQDMKQTIKQLLPPPLALFIQSLRNPRQKEAAALLHFLLRRNQNSSFFQRLSIVKQLYVISAAVTSAHTQYEVISFINAILSIPTHIQGCVVEAGCYKGGSTAKFSKAAKLAGRKLIVFDSFEGIPDNNEQHDKNIFGDDVFFHKGNWCGRLEEVRDNVTKYGEAQVCEFVKGWFNDTLPKFSEPIVAVYLDVDLASSTATCLEYLYPRLVPGGILFSQDGHLPLVLEVLSDDQFWKEKVGCPKPHIEGLYKQKLIKIVKPTEATM